MSSIVSPSRASFLSIMGLGIASVLIGMGGGREIKFLAGRVKGGARTGVLRTIFGLSKPSSDLRGGKICHHGQDRLVRIAGTENRHFCNRLSCQATPHYSQDAPPPPGTLLIASDKIGVPFFFEVRDSNDGVIEAVTRGEVVDITKGEESGIWNVKFKRWDIDPNDEWVQSFPALKAFSIKSQKSTIRRKQYQVEGLMRSGSLVELEEAVLANPTDWVDGTSPSNTVRSREQAALQCPGELIALQNRLRGVTMVQLAALWGVSVVDVPINRPYVTTLLRRIAEDKQLGILTSPAAGGLGLSALIFPLQEPFIKYSRHLASFGCQAAVVAQSSYYKALVGSALGYSKDSIVHHIRCNREQGEPLPTPDRLDEIFRLVDTDLSSLPPSSPDHGNPYDKIPWDSKLNGNRDDLSAMLKSAQEEINNKNGFDPSNISKGESQSKERVMTLEEIMDKRKKAKKMKKNNKQSKGGFGGGFGS
ncbi:hypothetical protein AAMO2058_000961700 [Amorphochlora amoebiformis]